MHPGAATSSSASMCRAPSLQPCTRKECTNQGSEGGGTCASTTSRGSGYGWRAVHAGDSDDALGLIVSGRSYSSVLGNKGLSAHRDEVSRPHTCKRVCLSVCSNPVIRWLYDSPHHLEPATLTGIRTAIAAGALAVALAVKPKHEHKHHPDISASQESETSDDETSRLPLTPEEGTGAACTMCQLAHTVAWARTARLLFSTQLRRPVIADRARSCTRGPCHSARPAPISGSSRPVIAHLLTKFVGSSSMPRSICAPTVTSSRQRV